MLKFMKYEFKGFSKKFAMLLVVMAILNLAIMIRYNGNVAKTESTMTFFVLANFAAGLTVLIVTIKQFEDELYKDRGYLTFTLPLKGWQIVGAKLLLALICYIVVGIMVILFFKLGYSVFHIEALNMHIDLKVARTVSNMLEFIIMMLLNVAEFMTIVYLSISLSRVFSNRVKLGKLLSFVIFVAIEIGLAYVAYKAKIHYSIGPDGFIVKAETIVKGAIYLYNIAVLGIAYFTTAYLIDNKIDL